MSVHVVLICSGAALFLGGLGVLLREQIAQPKPMPVYVEHEKPRESWDVVVRLYLSNADGRLKEIGGYMLKHHVDKKSAREEVDARLSQPEALDAEVKAFLLKYEYPPNVLYSVQAQRASGGYSMVSKYKAPISSEAPQ